MLALWFAAATAIGAANPAARPMLAQPSPGVVAPGASVELLADGYTFTEGPVADNLGGVYFSDVRTSQIHRWTPEGGASLYRADSGGANGLYFDNDGMLIVCESARKRIVRDDLAGQLTVVTGEYDGNPYNAPNDVFVDAKGGIYFSDPNFGGQDTQDGHHVYYIHPDGETVTRVTNDLVQPNGVIGTPDGTFLYITDSSGPTWRYRIAADGSLSDKTNIFDQGGDGMSLDELGNLYLASGVVWVFDADGNQVDTITIPERPSNIVFGGPEGKTLFVTARTGLYRVELIVRGAYAPQIEDPGPTPVGSPTMVATGTATIAPSATTAPSATAPPANTPTPGASGTPLPTESPTELPSRWYLYAPMTVRR